jgi:FkbM family methyltransferase
LETRRRRAYGGRRVEATAPRRKEQDVIGALKAILRGVGLYDRLRWSPLHDLYLRVVRPTLAREQDAELTFYRHLLADLGPGPLVFDIGANVGNKAALFLRLGARVVCLEPDRANVAVLNLRFAGKSVVVVSAAVSEQAGRLTLHLAKESSAFNTLSDKWVETLNDPGRSRFAGGVDFSGSYEVETVTLEQLIARHGRPGFIKIDVEGHEASVLRGLKQAVPLLSFELNLPEFLQEGLECIAHLGALDPKTTFNYVITDHLESPSWRGAEEFGAWLAGAGLRYCEVIAKTPS